MKNETINWWSFASAKLKAKRRSLLAIIAFAVIIGFSMSACDEGGDTGEVSVPPEEKSVKDRWSKWVADDSIATLDYSVAEDGVCTIIVGGTAQPNDETDSWGRWKASCSYAYTGKKDTSFAYKFEAWTQSGNREIAVQYYNDYENDVYLSANISITDERKPYTIWGDSLPKGNVRAVEFQCADQTGTFYVKILEITEYNIGKLTITNFSGTDGLTQNNDVIGNIYNDDGSVIGLAGKSLDGKNFFGIQVKGNTIILPLWFLNDEGTFTPFTGNKTIAVGKFEIQQYIDDDSNYYNNIVPINLINGNATIDFGNQMQMKPE